MVILGKGEEGKAEKLMAMGPERSKPLHNFKMPCLKWGNQRLLRCMKVNPNGEVSAAAAARRSSASKLERGWIGRRGESESERRGWIERRECLKMSPSPARGSGRQSNAESDGEDGIEAIREKLMFDLQAAADKMKDAILREGLDEEPPPAAVPTESEAVRPWNLRTRRAACKAPNGMNVAAASAATDGGTVSVSGGKGSRVDDRKHNSSPIRAESKSPRSQGVVTTAAAEAHTGEKRERAKFSVSLSRQEIEEDYMVMTGHRPPRRPKKRPKIVQRQLDSLFPGLWLTEVTADMYKVPDAPERASGW